MPSLPHEGLIELVRQRPAVVADLLAGPLKIDIPKFQKARLMSSDLTAVTPTEYRADGVVAFYETPEAENPAFAVVFEAQRRTDREKRLSWPVYVATTHARHDCPTALLVWCETRAVAKWAAEPISTGDPGLLLTPMAPGPDQMPVIPEGPTAREFPHLAVLSATYMVAALASASTRGLLEKIMTAADISFTEYAKFVFPETFAKGVAAGKAEGILAILGARGVTVPDEVRERISTCKDIEQLDAWIVRAATALRIEDLTR